MEQFVLTKIYGCESGMTYADAKAAKWRKQKNKNTLNLPPDSDSLHHHLNRVNYLTYCLKHYKLREHPSPIGNGWILESGKCRAVRYSLGPLPDYDIESDNEGDSNISSYDNDIDDETEYGSSTDSSSTDSDDD